MATFDFRDPVAPANLLPAVGVGFAAGIAAGYLASLLIRRVPFPPDGDDGTLVTSGPLRVPIVPVPR